MKKILLAGSAIAAASLVGAGVANAADPLRLGVRGYFQAYYWYVDQDQGVGTPGAATRDHDFVREAEVWFMGETTLDNGLKVGARIEIEAEAVADQIDENYLYFSGSWGEVRLGSSNGAGYRLFVHAPQVDGNFDWAEVNYRVFNVPTAAAGGSTGGLINMSPNLDADTEKLTYMTPVWNGFQAGISYAPSNCESFAAGQGRACGASSYRFGMQTDAAGYQDAWNLGARYTGTFEQFKVTLGGAYARVDLAAPPAGLLDDRRQWNLGGTVEFSGFNLGASYFDDDRGLLGSNDLQAWQIGANYTTGPWTFGISWAEEEGENDANANFAGTGDDEITRVLVGASYTYGPGMTLRGALHFYDLDGQTAADSNDVFAITLGTVVFF